MVEQTTLNVGDISAILECLRKIQALAEQTKRVMEQTQLLNRVQMLGQDKVFEFNALDNIIRMYLPFAGTDFIQSAIVRDSVFWEFDLLKFVHNYISADSVIIDAGANIGNHALFFSMICRAKEVICFEPMQVTFEILQKNIQLNHLKNVRLLNCALGSVAGNARLTHLWAGNMGGATLKYQPEDGRLKERIYPVTTIDSLALPELSFLKVDVEGGHIEVISGARETLRRCRPVVWVELRDEKNEFGAGNDLLRELGYRHEGLVGKSKNDHLFVLA